MARKERHKTNETNKKMRKDETRQLMINKDAAAETISLWDTYICTTPIVPQYLSVNNHGMVIRSITQTPTWESDPNLFLIPLLLNNISALCYAYLPPAIASTAADKGHLHAYRDIFWRKK